MKTRKTTAILPLAIALLSLAMPGNAQLSLSGSFVKSYGDSDAGVNVNGSAAASGYNIRTYIPGMSSGGTFGTVGHYETLMTANASARVYADLRFLGGVKRAGDFRMGISATFFMKHRSPFGSVLSSTCNSNGTVYLKIGDSVIWNSSYTTTFAGRRNLRLRVMVPSLVVPLGGGLVLLNGNVYANVRAAMDATLDPCTPRARLDGEAAVSGDATASATVISVLAIASVSATFYANEQKVDANALTIQPNLGPTSTWRTGNVVFHSGAMRGWIDVSGVLFPIIPVSTTLANWSKPATSQTIL